MNSERVLDAQGNFVTLKSTPKYDNPLEKEVKVLKEENATLKNIVKSKNDELKECKKELAVCQGKYAQLIKESETKETKSTWRKSKKQK